MRAADDARHPELGTHLHLPPKGDGWMDGKLTQPLACSLVHLRQSQSPTILNYSSKYIYIHTSATIFSVIKPSTLRHHNKMLINLLI